MRILSKKRWDELEKKIMEEAYEKGFLNGITQKRANEAFEKFSKDHDHAEAMKNMKPHTQTYKAGPNGEAIKIIEPIQILPTHTHNMPPLSNEMLAEKINEIINHINK